MQGVMIKSWKAEISRVPTLLADAIEYGLSKLGYESIKPEQWHNSVGLAASSQSLNR